MAKSNASRRALAVTVRGVWNPTRLPSAAAGRTLARHELPGDDAEALRALAMELSASEPSRDETHLVRRRDDLHVVIYDASAAEPAPTRDADARRAASEHWHAALAHAPQELGLIPDRARPARPGGRTAWHVASVPPATVTGLAHLGERLEARVETVLLAAFKTLLSRWGRQDDLIVGVWDGMAGVVPVRTYPAATRRFQDFLAQVERACSLAVEHGAPETRTTVQAGFTWHDAGADLALPMPSVATGLDLGLTAVRGAGGIELMLEYAPELYESSTVASLCASFLELLHSLVRDPALPLGRLGMLTPEARRTVLEEFTRTDHPYPTDQTLHGLFEAQARRVPHATALVFDDLAYTYAGFNAEANRLAHHLRRLGVREGTLVGLCLDRGPDLVIAVYAILKAGGAYVPLDPLYPKDRLGVMLDDAEMPFLVTADRVAGALPPHRGRVVDLTRDREAIAAAPDSDLPPGPDAATPDSLCYMIYTSGSTGKPKGVLVAHKNVVNFLHAMRRICDFKDDEVTLSANTISFDIVIPDLFLNFALGGTLVLTPREAALDGRMVADLIQRHRVTNMLATPSTWRILLDAGWQGAKDLRIIAAGEALPKALAEVLLGLGKSVWNGYGPTEITVISNYYQVEDLSRPTLVGKAIDNVYVYILDEQLTPVPPGAPGELYIAGAGVARGYLKREQLTAERFLPNPYSQNFGGRMYKTGDLGRFAPDGAVEYLGRNDDQVKIRGFRIELGDVEAVLSGHDSVDKVVAMAREDEPGDQRLVGYYTLKAGRSAAPAELRAFMAERLPTHMVPNHFVAVRTMPLNPNGKVDRRALPKPAGTGETASRYTAPKRGVEKALAELWQELLKVPRVGVDDHFFEMGGNSLLAVRLCNRLRAEHQIVIPVLKLFQFPTIGQLARWHAESAGPGEGAAPSRDRAPAPQLTRPRIAVNEKIAIVGMAIRCPGAESVEELWANLTAGTESISFFAPAELDPTLDPALVQSPQYVKARGLVKDGDRFDAAFFGIAGREAEVMDPQHRQFLEMVWTALESGGYTTESYGGKIGVYAGTGTNTYYPEVVRRVPGLIDRAGAFQVMVANEKDYVSTRVMHRLDLKGPAVSVQTACSTSLVAVHLAVQALRLGECEIAVAGGSASTSPLKSGYLYQEGAMLSPDGHTRSFDRKAAGTVFSDGCGAVLLKRLSDALADGDQIHGVIIGSAINNDGGAKASFTAPSVDGQAAVIEAALADAGVDAAAISYVEAHGTATPLGDPIEVEALTKAFRRTTDRRGYCALGTIKSNVGHMTAAAGVAGLIKTALCLTHEQLVPTLHYERPNPQIDLDASPFTVNAVLKPWRSERAPLRAGVSSFGVGGTNAHVIVEQPPARPKTAYGRPTQLFVLSAKSAAAAAVSAEALAKHLEASCSPAAMPGAASSAAPPAGRTGEAADVAYTLAVGRKALPWRISVVARTPAEAAKLLRQARAVQAQTKAPRLAFLFPGQGAQHVGMGRQLHGLEPVFREALEECAAVLDAALPAPLLALIHAEPGEAAEARLTETRCAQPALFAVEYALARYVMSLGFTPDVLIGHSVGEFVAACLAGVMTLKDACLLVALRGKAMQEQPPGAMLSVRLPEREVPALLAHGPAGLALAAVNAPSLSVVAGPAGAIAALKEALTARDVPVRLLRTSHAFHSPMMDPAVKMMENALASVPLSPPKIQILSTVTGKPMTDAEATSPQYWARHLRLTVRFADAVQAVLAAGDHALLEVGPRDTLTVLARQQAAPERRAAVIPLTGEPAGPASPAGAGGDDEAGVLGAIGALWRAGLKPDWQQLFARAPRRRVALPTYPFERQRHWPEVPTLRPAAAAPPKAAVGGSMSARHARLVFELKTHLEEASGIACAEAGAGTSFLELGLDSLFLTQFALKLQKKYGLKVTFRQLLEQYATFEALATLLDKHLPAEVAAPAAVAVASGGGGSGLSLAGSPNSATANAGGAMQIPSPAAQPGTVPNMMAPAVPTVVPTGLDAVVMQQLQLMQRQLEMLSGRPAAPLTIIPAAPQLQAVPAVTPPPPPPAPVMKMTGKDREFYDAKKAFGAAARITLKDGELPPRQKQAFDAFVARYTSRTKESKRLTQRDRPYLADPRVVTGFRPALKEIVYQIIINRSKGSRLWDVDGNEYIDALCGFGMNFFGWSPDFIVKAVREQIENDMCIGPQTPLAGEVAKLLCEVTGFDRAGFCNTGSEAVMGCMRIARTVTGRDRIVIFSGSYHGIFDEVIVRGTRGGKAIPAAPGIMPQTAENVVVLEYGTPESLEWIRAHAHDVAAVLCETIQSRRADFQPKEFLQEVREICTRTGAALIFDEVITGFRLALGGAQQYFGIRADLAAYGKVIGGGFPIGVIAGRKDWADALDGGFWSFGDASKPEVGVTYFAGTFVRHPPALAAAKAVLLHLQEKGPGLQVEMNGRTAAFTQELNAWLKDRGVPMNLKHMGSLWRTTYSLDDLPFGDVFFAWMRSKGVHIWDGFPCFFTTAHTPEDAAQIMRCFKECVTEMQAGGLFPGNAEAPAQTGAVMQPPVPGARLGRDPQGYPAWYVADPKNPGKYVKVN